MLRLLGTVVGGFGRRIGHGQHDDDDAGRHARYQRLYDSEKGDRKYQGTDVRRWHDDDDD
ncbi:MAG: hypothetical protein FJX25_12040 [Alphaproteobacteria bacterium]|nr:hypothetical protein [Alphaproteobacteria bacterium]